MHNSSHKGGARTTAATQEALTCACQRLSPLHAAPWSRTWRCLRRTLHLLLATPCSTACAGHQASIVNLQQMHATPAPQLALHAGTCQS